MASQVISPKALAHVVLRTSPEKLKEMREFYLQLLGAKVSYENDWACFMTYDFEHHRIAVIAIPGIETKKIAASPGLEHIAFTHSSLRELLTAWTGRKNIGIEPVWTVNHGPTMSMYYRDPNGNHIEMQADVFETAEEATQYMMGPEYSENAIGADFDPEDLLRRLDAGEPEKKLMERPNVGPRGLDTVPLLA